MSGGHRGTALITGASAGIGSAYARALARRGHDLVLVARRRSELDEVARAVADAAGVQVEVLVADLADPRDRDRVVRRVDELGPLAVLVNNAGFGAYGRFAEMDPRELSAVFAVGVTAVAELTRAVLVGMLERGSGDVINLASLLAFANSLPPDPLPHRVAYGSIKTWVVAFTELLAGELAGSGVRVQALCPALVRTDFHELAGNRDLPDELMMDPDVLVDVSLRALERGETICLPTVEDGSLAVRMTRTAQEIFTAGRLATPAPRYASREQH